MLQEKLTRYVSESILQNWEKPALSDYQGATFTFQQVAEHITQLHLSYEQLGIKPGDKIAMIGKNSANWGITFFSIVSFGAVAVPILPDFIPNDVQEIVNHSDSRLLIASDAIFSTLDASKMKALVAVMSIESFEFSYSTDTVLTNEAIPSVLFNKKFPNGVTRDDIVLPEISNSELAMISYTSGTTGNSKGVMLSHNSLSANVRFARENMPLKSGDKIVSFLPMAHSYGLAFEFMFPFTLGCHITFLTKTPSPQIITKAFGEIKPELILSVPLVIEKIFKKKVLPAISKPPVSILIKIPLVNKLIFKKIKKGLSEAFGDNFLELIIGGAPFNIEAEQFFRKIKFPYTIGYGMTECGPLISYAAWNVTKMQSAGKSVDTLEVKIDSEDPKNIAGEILIKGENVMEGYYKNPEATAQAIDKDGWLHSGDLGVIDEDGFIFIKGRSKSMILGASGQNIYPEEIESVINNKDEVLESLVIQQDEKLVALVCPDKDVLDKLGKNIEDCAADFEVYRKEINKQLPAYMGVSKFIVHPEEFVKTPKRSIKRFLYADKDYS